MKYHSLGKIDWLYWLTNPVHWWRNIRPIVPRVGMRDRWKYRGPDCDFGAFPGAAVVGIRIDAADFEQTPALTVEHFLNAARYFGLSPVIWSDHHEANWRMFTTVQQRPR